MAASRPKDNRLKFIMFSGKGGVGKTTSAAAAAIYYAGLSKKTLLFSTDPAHSLSDSLEQRIGDSVQKIQGTENLFAIEINPDKMLQEYKNEFREEIVRLLTTTTYLDEEDVSGFFSLTIPGLDEVMGLKRITDFIEETDYELYIWDTAPTGHTLRLLALPEMLNDWVRVLARMRWKYKEMLVRLMKKDAVNTSDDFLLTLKKTVNKVGRFLKEPGMNRFVAVTIPEAMAVNETGRMINLLTTYGISVKHILVNNVVPVSADCSFCISRRKAQQQYINAIRKEFQFCEIIEVLQNAKEVRGISSLREFARQCSGLFW